MPLKNRRNQTSLAHSRSKSESRAINICLATNGGCPFSPLGVNVETVRTIFTIVPPAAPTSSTCFLTHNVISRVSARCTRVYEASSAKFYLVNVGGTTWRADPWTRIYAHCSAISPLFFFLLAAHCDALFLFALKTYTAEIVLEHMIRDDFSSTSKLFYIISAYSTLVLSITKMIFCM